MTVFEVTRELRSQREQFAGNLRCDSAHGERRGDAVLTWATRDAQWGKADRWVKAGCGLLGRREVSAAAEKRGLCPLADFFHKPYEPHLSHRRSEWGEKEPRWRDEMRNPAPASLHFCYGTIVLIWGPGERLPSCPWSLGIEYSGHQPKEGRGEDHSSSWGKGRIRSWAHSGRREEAGTPGGPHCRKPGMRYRFQFWLGIWGQFLIRIPEKAPSSSHPHHLPKEISVTNRAEREGQESPRAWKETLSESQREDRTWNQTDVALVNPRHKLSLQECWRQWYAEGNYSNKSQPSPAPDTGDPAKGKACPQKLFIPASPVLHAHVVLSTKNHKVFEKARKSNTSLSSEKKKQTKQHHPRQQSSELNPDMTYLPGNFK